MRHTTASSMGYCVVATSVLGMSASLCWAQPSITNLGVLPGKTESRAMTISDDGLTIAGQSSMVGQTSRTSFLWTRAAGMIEPQKMPFGSTPLGISSDGSVIVGYGYPDGGGTSRAFRWAAADGLYEDLGALNSVFVISASDVSASGSVVVGISGFLAFRWTAATGMQDLGRLPGASTSTAQGVSADGAIIVGNSGNLAYRWTEGTGMVSLGLLSSAFASTCTDISPDGDVIVGYAIENGFNRGFGWTEDEGMIEIPLVQNATILWPWSVSENGSVIVGEWHDGQGGGGAMIWTAKTGSVDLRDYLASLAWDVTGWTLHSASCISADGTKIVGVGDFNGEIRGWLVELRECRADFNDDSSVDSQDFFDFLTAFFDATPRADFNDDGAVNSQDFFEFLGAFFTGC